MGGRRTATDQAGLAKDDVRADDTEEANRAKPKKGDQADVTKDNDQADLANKPPVPDIAVSCEDRVCSFDGSGSNDPDGTVTNYAWRFGDGSTDTGSTTSRTYQRTGRYSVKL